MDFTPCLIGVSLDASLIPEGPFVKLVPKDLRVSDVLQQFAPNVLRDGGNPWVFSLWRDQSPSVYMSFERPHFIHSIVVRSEGLDGADPVDRISLWVDGSFVGSIEIDRSCEILLDLFCSDITLTVTGVRKGSFVRDHGVIESVEVFGLYPPSLIFECEDGTLSMEVDLPGKRYYAVHLCSTGRAYLRHPGYSGSYVLEPVYSGTVVVTDNTQGPSGGGGKIDIVTEVYDISSSPVEEILLFPTSDISGLITPYDLTACNVSVSRELVVRVVGESEVLQENLVSPGRKIIFPRVDLVNVGFSFSGEARVIIQGLRIG